MKSMKYWRSAMALATAIGAAAILNARGSDLGIAISLPRATTIVISDSKDPVQTNEILTYTVYIENNWDYPMEFDLTIYSLSGQFHAWSASLDLIWPGRLFGKVPPHSSETFTVNASWSRADDQYFKACGVMIGGGGSGCVEDVEVTSVWAPPPPLSPRPLFPSPLFPLF